MMKCSMFHVLCSMFSRPRTLNIEQSFRNSLLIAALLLLSASPASTENFDQNRQSTEEKIYLVNEYRYVPANETDDRDVGLSLCGTRCNALATDYRNITEPMGWQMMKGATNQELVVELNSQFIGGHCICVVDEYLVKKEDRRSIENRRPRVQEGSAGNNQE